MNLDETYILLLNKKVSQFNFFQVLYTHSFQVLKTSNEMKVVGYCMIFQTCFSLPVVKY